MERWGGGETEPGTWRCSRPRRAICVTHSLAHLLRPPSSPPRGSAFRRHPCRGCAAGGGGLGTGTTTAGWDRAGAGGGPVPPSAFPRGWVGTSRCRHLPVCGDPGLGSPLPRSRTPAWMPGPRLRFGSSFLDVACVAGAGATEPGSRSPSWPRPRLPLGLGRWQPALGSALDATSASGRWAAPCAPGSTRANAWGGGGEGLVLPGAGCGRWAAWGRARVPGFSPAGTWWSLPRQGPGDPGGSWGPHFPITS